MAALRAGHPHAFEAIYDRYHAQILAFCRHLLSSREDAEDAAQHVFVSAYRDLVSSERAIEVRPWLYTIARNRCLSMLRARRETFSLADVSPASTAGLSEIVQGRADLQELVADVRRLPDEQREALVLFELGDLSQTEIAHVLGRDAKQVKALVFQARTALMGFRDARQIDCSQIREELATARGADLLRGHLRRHLRTCDACKEFSQAVKRQRTDLALLLPVIPTAGLKAATMAAAGLGGGGAAGGGAAAGTSGLLFFGAKGAALKVAAGVLLAAGAVTTTVEVTHTHHGSPSVPAAGAQAGSKAAAAARALHGSASTRGHATATRTSGHLKAAEAKERVTTVQTPSSSASHAQTKVHTNHSNATPVRGAKRQSTGHGEKAQRGAPSQTRPTAKGRTTTQTRTPNPNAVTNSGGNNANGPATGGSTVHTPQPGGSSFKTNRDSSKTPTVPTETPPPSP